MTLALKNLAEMPNEVEIDIVEEKQDNANNIKDIGGWGYCVCFGTIITFISGIGHVNSFGLIYNDFITETSATANSLTTAHGVFAIMLAFGGIALNIWSKKFPLRHGGLLGSVLFTTGSFATIPITNISQITLTFGVLQGIGFGMMVPVCYATLNYYFVNKRTMVMSACKAAQGIILIGYPQLIKFFTSYYGFRGTLLIMSAISLHSIAGMLIMKSPETRNKPANKHSSGNSKELANLVTHNAVRVENARVNQLDASSWENKGTGFHMVLETLNLKVMKDPVYRNICLGQSFVNFSDLTFFILQPMLLFQYGYDRNQVATCISICYGADVVGRCLMTAVSSALIIDTRMLFYFSALATFVGRIVLLQVRNFLWVAIGTAALGLLRAWLHIASPLVIANHVSHENFPGAYALSTLATGVVNVVVSPMIGYLKDSCQDYVPAFYALTACCLPCLLLWPLEYTYKKK